MTNQREEIVKKGSKPMNWIRAFLFLLACILPALAGEAHWPQFRGIGAAGVAAGDFPSTSDRSPMCFGKSPCPAATHHRADGKLYVRTKEHLLVFGEIPTAGANHGAHSDEATSSASP